MKIFTFFRKTAVQRALAVLFWLLIWELGARALASELLLASPTQTFRTLVKLTGEADFWSAIAFSASRIVTGFFLAVVVGAGLAFVSSRFETLAILLEPVLLLIRSTPVASLTILILLWVGSRNLSVILSFMMVVPVIYQNTLTGIRRVDPKLNEMARVFRLSPVKRFRYLIAPTVFPFFRSALQSGLGFCWKSGVAAEVIGIPGNSIGEKLYQAKIYLSTGELFAWTIVIIVISYLFERLVLTGVAALQRAITGQIAQLSVDV